MNGMKKFKFPALVVPARLIPALMLLAVVILAGGVMCAQGCKNQPKAPDPEAADSEAADPEATNPEELSQNSGPYYHGVLSLNGISFDISTSGPASMQKLRIQPAGLSISNREMMHEIDGRVVEAEIADLNSDGYPEVLIYTQSAGSGSYGDVIAYSANNGKSVSQVYFPPISNNPEASEGYMGHDEFTVIETSLAHRFPIYKEGDTNAQPTGSMRQIQYKMVDGEASRRFEIVRITEFPNNKSK